MYKRLALATACLLVAVTSASNFLSVEEERFLQSSGAIYTATCAADSSCATGNCCAQYRKVNGTSVTNVTNTCVSTQLHNKMVLFGGLNHTFVCSNATLVTANAGT